MSTNRDPVDALRQAWRQLDAPHPQGSDRQPPKAEVLSAAMHELTPLEPSAVEPETQSAIEWVRSRIAAVEVPPQPTPTLATRARRPWPATVAAAGLILAGLTLAHWNEPKGRPQTSPVIARADANPRPPGAGRAARITEGGIELHAGAVRLLIVQPTTTHLKPR